MLVRSERSTAPLRTILMTGSRRRLGMPFAALIAASTCLLVGACSDQHQAAAATATPTQQDSPAPPADTAAQPTLTIQTPAHAPTTLGAAASASLATPESLATPVIHTVE